ncbi:MULTISPECIES: phytoene/squalene synthase family protein [Methylosinus]|uniref:Phytoene/squalene synthase family protein n=1 Tax=Methylosinus trichosporium (strain ATCC 35070 / NCIMB 11131 / UNIQEM 75 / OB3b) TaxID=595536 RepID=A0A2D2CW69_METT3|nr:MULTISPECIES: squalene/phytoene synthase family protein [Methylosinus]ATQ66970.1 phytoene/squalene synthase family protein [Methylosinus trichosporium OB3b]OBS54061.1 squalene synthase [Methylosinus sp. 3S-1]
MDDAPTHSDAELAENYRRCEKLVREQDIDLWLATLFAPAQARPHLHAIGAFAVEVAGVRAKTSQPLLGEMRLRWWYDALEAPGEAGAGEESGGARAHPIADALIDTLDRRAIAREEVVRLLEAHVFDLYDEPMETMEALETYCDNVFGAPMRWRAAAIDAEDAARQDEALRSAGRAAGLAWVMRSLPRHIALGQRFVPAELMARHRAEEDFAHARATPTTRAALAELSARARAHYETARRSIRDDGAARAALLPAALVPLYLRPMEGAAYDPFRPPAPPAQWRRQWRLWRAARSGGL